MGSPSRDLISARHRLQRRVWAQHEVMIVDALFCGWIMISAVVLGIFQHLCRSSRMMTDPVHPSVISSVTYLRQDPNCVRRMAHPKK